MSPEAALDESQNPIWVLLAKGEEPNLWLPPSDGQTWQEALGAATAGLTDGDELIVSVPRPLARSMLARLTGRKPASRRGPTPKTVAAMLEGGQVEVVSSYGLWPTARSPRVAFPWRRFHVFSWLQTSGVIGGGGNRLWARIVARSLLFSPLAAALTPGLALVVRRRRAG